MHDHHERYHPSSPNNCPDLWFKCESSHIHQRLQCHGKDPDVWLLRARMHTQRHLYCRDLQDSAVIGATEYETVDVPAHIDQRPDYYHGHGLAWIRGRILVHCRSNLQELCAHIPVLTASNSLRPSSKRSCTV